MTKQDMKEKCECPDCDQELCEAEGKCECANSLPSQQIKEGLEKAIERIVKEAIEGQMDWEAYYEAATEETVKEIMSLFEQELEACMESAYKKGQKDADMVWIRNAEVYKPKEEDK